MAIKKISYIIKKIFKKSYAKYYFTKHIEPCNAKFKPSIPKSKKVQNILYLNTYIGVGGAAKIAYNMLCKNVQKYGFISNILVDRVIGIKQDKDVILYKKNSSQKQKLLYKAMFKLGWLDFFHLSSFSIKELEAFNDCDILHLNNLHGNYFNPFALPELTALKPTVLTVHDMQLITGHCAFSYECNNWKDGCKKCPDLLNTPSISKDTALFLQKKKQEIYKNSDITIVCYSKWMKKNLEQSILKDKNIRLIYNGINTEIFRPYDKAKSRAELGLPKDKKILLFASNCSLHNKQKGGEYLLDVYKKLNERDDVLFLALGNEKRESINENFLCLEYIKDENIMAKYYSAADVFVFPTLAESFGLVIAEAMACETPVVSFNTGPVPEIIDHNINGYIANYKDTDDFTKGVELFINDSKTLEEYSKQARIAIKDKFSLERMINEYTALYNELLEKRCSTSKK